MENIAFLSLFGGSVKSNNPSFRFEAKRGLAQKKINKKLQKKPKKEYYYTKILKEIYRQIKAKHKYAIQEMKREPWELRFFKVVELYKEKITKLRFVDSTARSDVRYIRMWKRLRFFHTRLPLWLSISKKNFRNMLDDTMFRFGFFRKLYRKRMTLAKQRILTKWANRRLKKKRRYRRSLVRINNAWGNIGILHLKKYRREKMLLKKELLFWTGKKYLQIGSNSLISNRLKYFKYWMYFEPMRKKDKKHTLSFKYAMWSKIFMYVLEKSRYLNVRYSPYVYILTLLPIDRTKKYFGHPFHLVSPSVLPVTLSFGLFCVVQSILSVIWIDTWHSLLCSLFHITVISGFFGVLLTWILEVFSEEQSGAHTLEVQKGFQYAVLLFILSELMLFFSFFWAYFHFSLNSNSFTGGSYLPKGLIPFDWKRIPLLNTTLLLASGVSLSVAHILIVEWDRVYKFFLWTKLLTNLKLTRWFRDLTFDNSGVALAKIRSKIENVSLKFFMTRRHRWKFRFRYYMMLNYLTKVGRVSFDAQVNLPIAYAIKFKNLSHETVFQANFWLLDTVIKGFVFLIYQAYEYTSCMFSINDSVYGAVFFSLTGLHGLHVFIGVMFLFTCLMVNLKKSIGRRRLKKRRSKVMAYIDKVGLERTSYIYNLWSHRIAFDGAAWYWHFVDVVWLFVFIFIYWWGFSF